MPLTGLKASTKWLRLVSQCLCPPLQHLLVLLVLLLRVLQGAPCSRWLAEGCLCLTTAAPVASPACRVKAASRAVCSISTSISAGAMGERAIIPLPSSSGALVLQQGDPVKEAEAAAQRLEEVNELAWHPECGQGGILHSG